MVVPRATLAPPKFGTACAAFEAACNVVRFEDMDAIAKVTLRNGNPRHPAPWQAHDAQAVADALAEACAGWDKEHVGTACRMMDTAAPNKSHDWLVVTGPIGVCAADDINRGGA